MLDKIDLFEEIRRWGRNTFNSPTREGILLHLREEVKELLDEPADCLEMADIVILLIQLAALDDIKLEHAIENKFNINKVRQWEEPDDNGIVRHKT